MSSRKQRSLRTERAAGFTMLELVVVLTLMAILTAVVVPIYSGSVSSLQSRNALKNFVALLKFVQEKAVSEGTVYRVCMDEDDHTYWVLRANDEPNEDLPFVRVKEHYGQVKHLPRGMEFSRIQAKEDREGGYAYIECFPNGASDAVEVRFRLENDNLRRPMVKSEGMMGRVKLEE